MVLLETSEPWQLSSGPWAHPHPREAPESLTKPGYCPQAFPSEAVGLAPHAGSLQPVTTPDSQSLAEQPVLAAPHQVPQCFHPLLG